MSFMGPASRELAILSVYRGYLFHIVIDQWAAATPKTRTFPPSGRTSHQMLIRVPKDGEISGDDTHCTPRLPPYSELSLPELRLPASELLLASSSPIPGQGSPGKGTGIGITGDGTGTSGVGLLRRLSRLLLLSRDPPACLVLVVLLLLSRRCSVAVSARLSDAHPTSLHRRVGFGQASWSCCRWYGLLHWHATNSVSGTCAVVSWISVGWSSAIAVHKHETMKLKTLCIGIKNETHPKLKVSGSWSRSELRMGHKTLYSGD